MVDRGGRRVLHGLDFAVRRGTVTGLLGPNGSGKTTLMRSIVGVQKIRAKVTVLGEPAGARTLRRRIGFVTQAPSIYADLTVRENARYFASLYRLPRTAADEAVRDMGLDAVAGRLAVALSGGERARTSLQAREAV
jgi:ABC-2 type transport system ATP-binding protein